MKLTEHNEQIDAALDALATDPDVPADQYRAALIDIARRCRASADNVRVHTIRGELRS